MEPITKQNIDDGNPNYVTSYDPLELAVNNTRHL